MPHAHAFQNISRGLQNIICVELFSVRNAPRMDLSGMLTEYSMSLIKPADLNVPDKLNKVSVLVIHSVGLQKSKKHDPY